ncbi:MAG: adenylate/guanylate cyclase domain-containing protein [Spirochaetales bacterium]|nr:adenylate/guanylate cyclase domain-containing protein [Spirochaetales bacterium]
MSEVPEGPKKEFAFKSAFQMLKEIHWGFFSDLDAKSYPVLWKQLTIPHRKYPAIGELKRSISITEIFVAFIDIHGYTSFCREHKSHTAMLQLLDSCIENDIRQMCRINHVMGNRLRGDEIILVGTSAYDVMNTVIMIADYFGDRKLIRDSEIVKKRNEQILKLPKLTISAGVAGGTRYSVMVITAAGDLSGSVVNTAARLQGRANKVAVNKSHIFTTNQVVAGYKRTMEKSSDPCFSTEDVAFLDLGPVGFKGVELRLAEVLIDQDQMYRTGYQDVLNKLIDALKNHSWSDRAFTSLMDLIISAARMTPPFEVALPEDSEGLLSVSNQTVIEIISKIFDQFLYRKDYPAAVEGLKGLSEILQQVEHFDHAVLLYLKTVISGYSTIIETYNKHITAYTEKNKTLLFSSDENSKYENAKLSSVIYNMMSDERINRIEPEKRKSLWGRIAKDLGHDIESMPYLDK